MTKKACVIGNPIIHSLSPKLHGYWLKHYDINGSYTAEHVTEDALAEFFESLKTREFSGCNITLPHKEAAMRYMDDISDVAQRVGAINTVIVKDDSSLFGTNTDAYGFIENLKVHEPDLSPYKTHALVLGAGGAARAICVALLDEGFRVSISNRTIEKADVIAEKLGNIDVIPWKEKEAFLKEVTLLVNTTSLGMTGKVPLDLSLEHLSDTSLVTDIVYAPLYTNLLHQAVQRGNPSVTGIGMLLHQAVPGFEAWFGKKPEVTSELERDVLEDLL